MSPCNIYNIDSSTRKTDYQDTDNQCLRLSEFTKEFLEFAKADRRPGTIVIYKYALGRFTKMTNDIRLDEVTARHFDQYKSIRAAKVSPITTNIDLRSLRAAFQTAVRWKILRSNPFEGTRLIPIPQTEKSFISQDEFPKFISSIKEDWLKDIVLFAALTGLRRDELINLKKTDYDPVNNHVVIKSSENFQTKNGKIRVVPLQPTAQHIVHSRIALNQSQFIFFLDGGKPISGDYLSHHFKRYVRSFGLSENIHLHSLRHTFASWLVQQKTSLLVVQRLLGHGSITTTQMYSHLCMTDLQSGVLNLPDFKNLQLNH